VSSGTARQSLAQAKYSADYLSTFAALQNAVESVSNEFYTLEQSGQQGLTDPLYYSVQLGHTMIGAAGNLWRQGSNAIIGMSTAAGVWSAMLPDGQIFDSWLSWWEPVMVTVGAALFAGGFMLTFYAPLYPFVLYLLGALNWLMVCVEFMIALPLVALGVTHPEGHDFLGKAEVALMLTLSACLRPVLMVFGYLGGILLSYIGFSAVNYMFSSVLYDVFSNAGLMGDPSGHLINRTANVATYDSSQDQSYLYAHTPSVMNSIFGVVTGNYEGGKDQASSHGAFSGSSIADYLLIPILMVFYGYIVVEVVHFCFTLIHQLPDQVLRWIGGPVSQDRTQGVADKIQQGVSSAAKQASEMQGKATSGEGKAVGKSAGGSWAAGQAIAEDVMKMAAGGG
jgi:defect-in-organelle-trafficking protein DotA